MDSHPPHFTALLPSSLGLLPIVVLCIFWVWARLNRVRRQHRANRWMAQAAWQFVRGDDLTATRSNALVLALDPDCASALILRGMLLTQVSRFREAVADFDRAVALRPGSTLAIYRRGVAKHCLGDLDGAIADYDLAWGWNQAAPTLLPALSDAVVRLPSAWTPPAGPGAGPSVDLLRWCRDCSRWEHECSSGRRVAHGNPHRAGVLSQSPLLFSRRCDVVPKIPLFFQDCCQSIFISVRETTGFEHLLSFLKPEA